MNPHIETLVNFLRDFAAANADSFAPEQIDYLNQAAVAIVVLDEAVDNLVKERDEAIADRDWFYKLLASTAEQNDKESEEWDTEEEDSDAETNP